MYENIISKFIEAEVLIDDKAYQKIKSQDNSLKFTESLIHDLDLPQEGMLILTGEMVDQYLKSDDTQWEKLSRGSGTDVEDYKPLPQSKPIKDSPFDFKVLKDASRKSYTNGEIRDFSAYFGSRYHKLKEMLERKRELKSTQSMQELENLQDVVSVIGMVNDIRNTKNNHKIMEMEDETGFHTVLIHNENHSLFEEAERVVKDEVIGVIGTRKGTLVIASEIIHPRVPRIDEETHGFFGCFYFRYPYRKFNISRRSLQKIRKVDKW